MKSCVISCELFFLFLIFSVSSILYILALQVWMVGWVFHVPPLINGSRTSRPVQIMTEYFIDKEKYHYLLALHMNAAFCMGALTVVAVGTMYLGYFYHIFGMFRIAR